MFELFMEVGEHVSGGFLVFPGAPLFMFMVFRFLTSSISQAQKVTSLRTRNARGNLGNQMVGFQRIAPVASAIVQ